MGRKRAQVKALFDAVEQGNTFTLTDKGTPVAIVLPWNYYTRLRSTLAEAEERLVPPDQRIFADPLQEWSQGENLRTGKWPVGTADNVGDTVAYRGDVAGDDGFSAQARQAGLDHE